MLKVFLSAPQSALGSGFINYVQRNIDIVTLGRQGADIKFDYATDTPVGLPGGGDCFLHVAAEFRETTDEDIINIATVNAVGILKSCIMAKLSGIKHVVYVSSISTLLKENDVYFNYYALTKRQAEENASMYCRRHGITPSIIRPSQLFGINKSFARHQSFLYTMIEKISKGEKISIYGRNDAIRNFIFEENIYNLILHVVKNKLPGEFNAISTRDLHITEILALIGQAFGNKAEYAFLPDKQDIQDLGFEGHENAFLGLDLEFIDFEEGMKRIAGEWSKN